MREIKAPTKSQSKPNSSRKIPRAPRPVFSQEYQICVEHLRQAVSKSGLTQKTIAERLGKPTPYLSKVLKGRQFATLVEMRAICLAADIAFMPWVKTLDEILIQLKNKELMEVKRF